ncbi:LacI family DNA-binding transcriptional regulator [Luteimicrobium subarcticum]|uniref:LacI family transcriptional regulator n=1 Tax=Luteimicrobium subarcticum TaxID=620910 RepID=A0A2M8WVJ7_9MICO|nr:LacI family DNA-binding transcriptional regulator [Luteimicrobium subarcticum]PJI94949.1 LacI family transcriptional regulator [Luteimicrobium subarcticum]
MSRPTLSAVASRAGVSVSTASIAFSGSGPIADATRERVLDAARELGYTGPSPLGRQLRSGRSGIVGVVVGDHVSRTFRDPVAVRVLDGLVSELGAAGLGVLLIPGIGQDTDPLLQTAAMDVAVLVWGARSDDPTYAALETRGLPVVIGEGAPRPGVPLVAIADREGTAALGRHVVGLGHERVAAVALPFGCSPEHTGLADADRVARAARTPTRNRLDGLTDAGITPVAVWEADASLVEEGRAAGLALLDVPAERRPTAVLAQSDLLAAGVLLAAHDLGLRVPEDVSVAGFDGVDLPWLGADRLTTVRQPLEGKGTALGRAVVALLAGEEPGSVVLDVELSPGTTTGPAPR